MFDVRRRLISCRDFNNSWHESVLLSIRRDEEEKTQKRSCKLLFKKTNELQKNSGPVPSGTQTILGLFLFPCSLLPVSSPPLPPYIFSDPDTT